MKNYQQQILSILKLSFSFIIFFLLTAYSISAQQDSTFIFKKPGRNYALEQGDFGKGSHSLLAIIPEIHGFEHFTVGLNFSYANFFSNGPLISKTFIQIGTEYLPNQKIIVPKIKYWKALWIYGLGLNAGGNGLYYFKRDASSFALRPEIGICLSYFQINYGYTFFFNKKFEELNPNTFVLSCYLPIFDFQR